MYYLNTVHIPVNNYNINEVMKRSLPLIFKNNKSETNHTDKIILPQKRDYSLI